MLLAVRTSSYNYNNNNNRMEFFFAAAFPRSGSFYLLFPIEFGNLTLESTQEARMLLPRATVTLLLCSPNFPRASITRSQGLSNVFRTVVLIGHCD